MSRVKTSLDHKRIRLLVCLVLTVFVLLGYSLQSVAGSVYYSMVMQAYGTVSSPPVILEEGNVTGASTVYANKTSAKVSVEAPLFDYVDNNDPDVDSISDKGMHSNFTAQQYSPDSIYDTLSEENTEGIEDYVDNISDVDNSSDVGTHSNFENEKLRDGTYDTLTESAAVEEIIRDGVTQGQSTSATVTFSHTLGYSSGNNRLVVVAAGFEHSAGDINIASATYNGQSMTKIVQATVGGIGYSSSTAIFYILDSNLPVNSGSYSVVVTCASDPSADLWACAVSYIGVKQEAPDDYDSDSASSSTTMTSNLICDEDGSMMVQACVVGNTGSFNPSSGTTEVIEDSDINSASAVFDEKLGQDSGAHDLGCTHGNMNRGAWVGACWAPVSGDTGYELDIEVQFTNVIDFLPTEKLCIYTGTLGNEDLQVDYWNGTGWENLATDLTAYSCNEYSVSLTSVNFTIRFKGGTESSDTSQDQWQIDASLLRVEGAGDKEDAVDQQSNVDGPADVGIHSNFTAQQYGPDSINDTLREGNTGGASNTTLIDAESFEDTWPPSGWSETAFSNWNRESDYAYDGTWSADFDGAYGDPSGYLTTPSMNCSGASAIYVDFWWYDWGLDLDDFELEYYDGSVWDNYQDLDALESANGWHHYTENLTDNQYFISNFQIRWWAKSVSFGETGCVDLVTVKKEVQSADNYELDLEVRWTDIPYLLPNENISIYGGTMGAEDIKVDVWNGTGWENVFNDLSIGWNNASITNWLTTSNFTIRFKGGNETGDTNEDTWQIDVALIHIWHDGAENCELDLEVQWTSTDYTRTNEELCIKTGTTGAEDIKVDVWNGSDWINVLTDLTANSWNNVSVTSYLTSSTFTIRFNGGSETSDSTQDSWSIDAAVLHVWTAESTYDYVDNNTSNVGSPTDIGTHSNFTAQQYGPDSINDTLTEGGGGTVWLWQEDTSGYGSTSSYETVQFWSSWTTNSTTSGTVTKIGIYVFADPGNSPQVKLGIYDDSGDRPNNLLGETNAATITGVGWLDLDIVGGGVSVSASTTYHVAHITDIAPTTQWRYLKTATPVSDYRYGRVWDTLFDPAGATTKSGSYRYGAYRVGYDEPYRLDLEVQWTSVDYDEGEKELCIYGGSMTSEDLLVDVWNGTGWQNLFADLFNGWNNVSVSSYLTSSTFTIRFNGGSETSDSTQDSWDIDATLLHVWTSESTYDYVLRVVNQVAYNWTVNLQVYDSSNIGRLSSLNISLHDGTSSNQIAVSGGNIVKSEGEPYNLPEESTIYISMSNLQATTTSTSYLNVHLKIKVPNTSTYSLYVITFEIT